MTDLTVSATTTRPLVGATVINALMASTGDIGECGYIDGSGTVSLARANAVSTLNGVIGIIVAGSRNSTDGTLAAGERVSMVVHGPVYLGVDAAMDETKPVFVSSAVAGKLQQTQTATQWRVVGWPQSQTVLFVDPDPNGSVS